MDRNADGGRGIWVDIGKSFHIFGPLYMEENDFLSKFFFLVDLVDINDGNIFQKKI
jgi:hypothetical protein